MHQFIRVIGLLILFCSFNVSAASHRHKRQTSSETIHAWDYFSRHSSAPRVILSPGIGTPIYFGHVGLGLHFAGMFQITKEYPIYIGGETGINFFGSYYYSHYYYGSSVRYTDLPLLGTAVYRFNIPSVPSLHPFGGVAIGPHVALTGARGVAMEVAARHGIFWRASSKLLLQGEARVAIFGGDMLYELIGGVAFPL